MIELNSDGFEDNISIIKTEFKRNDIIYNLNCLRDIVPAKYDDNFVNCCLSLIEEAHLRVCGEYFIRETNIEKLNRINKCMTNISKYLSFSTSEQAATSEGLYVPLIEENTFFGLKEIQPTYLAQKDNKKSERKKKREKGLKSKEKPWLTTTLDKIGNSTFTIKTHSMIALMIYGLEVMKYGVMEGNSIFTIDHINGIHNDNNIENLQLLTRISNDKKRNKPQNWYLDYFIYWDTRVRQARINQEYLDFRRRI